MTAKQTVKSDNAEVFILGGLLSLYERVRGVSPQELQYIIANETYNLIQYEQAVLWSLHGGHAQISTMSGVSNPDKNGGYAEFLKKLYKEIFSKIDGAETIQFKDIKDKKLKKQWKEYLPSHLFLIPLFDKNKKKISLLLLVRNTAWSKNEKKLMGKISDLYGHELSIRYQENKNIYHFLDYFKNPKIKNTILIVIILLFFFPFRASVLAPAEIIAHEPDLIRSPIEGIVKKVLVTPNQKVEKDQVLVILDQATLTAQQEVSQNALKVAQAELRQASQQALNSQKARVRLSVLQGKVKKEKTNLQYYTDLLTRSEIRAPKAGTVIFEDVFDWLGRPVSTGERIMMLAQEKNTKLEIRLPVHDTISLKKEAKILFFSNARPDLPLKANLTFHSYRASETDNAEISYRLNGKWKNDKNFDKKRLGLKGTAKIYGNRRPLIWIILRKPFVQLRQFFGL